MATITQARDAAIKALKDLNQNQLSGRADCASPDSADSAGARMLSSVRDAVCETLEYLSTDDLHKMSADPSDVGWLDDDGQLHQIADAAPDVYTYTRWLEFVDLAAWQEDTEEYGTDATDLTAAAGIALCVIAERLVTALVAEAAETMAEAYDDDESYVDAARVVGREHGRNAASWTEIDGAGIAQRILTGIDDGDPAVMESLPQPDLSGEWADGYTVERLRDDVGAPDDRDDDLVTLSTRLADAYEEAFTDAAHEVIGARCRSILSDS